MRVNREMLRQCLDAVSPGLSKSDLVEQSSCFVFTQGKVCTYNDEVACQMDCPLEIEGAVAAAPVLELLSKLEDDYIDISIEDGELLVKRRSRRAGIRCEATIMLPIANVERGTDWELLSYDFVEAVDVVSQSAGKVNTEFVLTCVHISPTYLEACDDYQVTHYPMETGFSESVLVRGDNLRKIVGLDVTEFCETPNWLHFRNPTGLMYSMRRHLMEYPDVSSLLDTVGEAVTLPRGLVDALDKATVFMDVVSEGQVMIDLRPGRLLLEGRGASGWYQEITKVNYAGDPVRFMIAPRLLKTILKKASDCQITEGRIVIRNGKFIYVSCTGVVPRVAATV